MNRFVNVGTTLAGALCGHLAGRRERCAVGQGAEGSEKAMKELRRHLTEDRIRAHRILDDVRIGLPQTPRAVNWALRTLGDL